MVLEGELYGYPGPPERLNKRVLEQIKPKTSLEAKITKLKLFYFRYIMRKQGSLEKT